MTPGITIGTLTRGDLRLEYVGSLMQFVKHDPRFARVELRPTLYLHFGREEIARDFLANPSWGEWLLYVDDDTQFDTSAIDKLLAVADPETAPIVGGVYWSPVAGCTDTGQDVFPVVFSYDPGERGSQYADTFVHRPMPRGWVAAQTAPFSCDAIGTGFLMIHRSVLTRMFNHYTEPLRVFTMDAIAGVAAGEDLNFCARAKALGYPIIAVPLTPDDISHIKVSRVVRPNLIPEASHGS
jgi:hypothetical protein